MSTEAAEDVNGGGLLRTRWRQLALVPVAFALALSGCAGDPDGSGSDTVPDGTTVGVNAAARLVDAAAFEQEVQDGERFVLNVHTPDEGSIAGTSAAIPFDRLEERAAELPASRDTPLAVYCRTGTMSRTAVQDLADMGYDDIVELRGGMEAWAESGRTLLPAGAGPG